MQLHLDENDKLTCI